MISFETWPNEFNNLLYNSKNKSLYQIGSKGDTCSIVMFCNSLHRKL